MSGCKKFWIQYKSSTVNQPAIKMSSMSSSWAINQNSATILSATASFQGGSICAVIGPVGSGKVW